MRHLSLASTSTLAFMVYVAVLIATGWMQQKAVDRWAQRTGRAPMIQKGRGSWAAYMKVAEGDMPAALLKRIAVLNWVAYLTLAIFILFLFFNGGSNRH